MASRVKGHFDGLLCSPEPYIPCIQSSNYDPCLQVLRFRGWNREPITNKNSLILERNTLYKSGSQVMNHHIITNSLHEGVETQRITASVLHGDIVPGTRRIIGRNSIYCNVCHIACSSFFRFTCFETSWSNVSLIMVYTSSNQLSSSNWYTLRNRQQLSMPGDSLHHLNLQQEHQLRMFQSLT
jgi:hypothetical protein